MVSVQLRRTHPKGGAMKKSHKHRDHATWKGFDFLESTVEGIPCLVGFRWARAYRGERRNGLQIEPDEPEGPTEMYLFDRKGYLANWPEDKANKADLWGELEGEVLDYVRDKKAERRMEEAEFAYEQNWDHGWY